MADSTDFPSKSPQVLAVFWGAYLFCSLCFVRLHLKLSLALLELLCLKHTEPEGLGFIPSLVTLPPPTPCDWCGSMRLMKLKGRPILRPNYTPELPCGISGGWSFAYNFILVWLLPPSSSLFRSCHSITGLSWQHILHKSFAHKFSSLSLPLGNSA